MNFSKLKNRAGFTLIELIVVIAIMAILAGVAVPVYSGYIEKAEKASDLQLLGAVNGAFAAAVVENGSDVHSIGSADAKIESDMTMGAVSASGIDSTALNASFDRYFAGNENAAFKTITKLYFNAKDGVFVDDPEQALSEGQKVVLNYLKDKYGAEGAEIDQYLASTFNDMGSDELLGQVDWVAAVAANLLNSDTSSLSEIIFDADDKYLTNLAGSLDMTLDELLGYTDSMSDSEYNSFLANSAVLSVANSASTNTDLSKDKVTGLLTGGSAYTTIQGNLESDPETALAQAALAYGMYTAYANHTGDATMIKKAATISSVNDLNSILAELNTDGFKSYMAEGGQGQADLDGYLSALKIVSDGAAQDPDLTLDILNNGFSGLNGMLDSLGK